MFNKDQLIQSCILMKFVCRDKTVGIATGYGLDGQGIESRWGKIFRNPSDRPWSPTNFL